MSTVYNTPRGMTYDPLPVEIWKWDGVGPVGRLETSESITVTWADRGAGTAVIETPFNELSRLLLNTDGTTLVVIRFNGKRHISTVVEADTHANSDSRSDVMITATTASAWSMLDGQITPIIPGQPAELQGTKEGYKATGSVEWRVKQFITIGSERIGHPIHVMPSNGKGTSATTSTRWDTVSETVDTILTGSDLRLTLEPWLPGDDPVQEFSLTRPAIIADVVNYREQPGLEFSAIAQDLDDWKLRRTRASKTRVIVGNGEKGEAQKFVQVTDEGEVKSPWARREAYIDADEDADQQQAGLDELAESAQVVDLDAEINPSGTWEFGVDGQTPRQYDVGDWATVNLAEIGAVRQVVKEVTVELTPSSLTVTPKVATPDTKDRDLYTLVTSLDKRQSRQQRRR